MRYIGGAVTDIGIAKLVNQDSVCLKIAETELYGQTAMAVICDGVGGLTKGELASAEVIRSFEKWFRDELPKKIGQVSLKQLSLELDHLIRELNCRIWNHGKMLKARLGTTCSILLIAEGEYLILHVGDCKIYEIRDSLQQLTEDQTFVAWEMKYGRMTPKEAAMDRRRNMLLQCVGASERVTPDVCFGRVRPDTVYLLCSDGFRNRLTERDIFERLNPVGIANEEDITRSCRYLVDLAKRRNEEDNISVILLKSVE